jgi:hypothetical protein
MIKRDELANPNSCLNRAADNEPIFVLRGKDVAIQETIRNWIRERIRLGKNKINDTQISEAFDFIGLCDLWQNQQATT